MTIIAEETNLPKFGKRASTPKAPIKTVYWRGDVIDVVNRLIGYDFVIPDSQAWYWTSEWQESVARSVEQINAGQGTVHDDQGFFAALDG